MNIFVNQNDPRAHDGNDAGTREQPFLSIGAAAQVARAGDMVLIHAGIYREWVRPARGGEAGAPITFEAAAGEVVWLKGSDVWAPKFETLAPGVVRARLDAALFEGGFNPFAVAALNVTGNQTLGQLFCGGEPLVEVSDEDELRARPATWMTTESGTFLSLHFPIGADERTLLEISTRAQIFAPLVRGLGYITLRNLGFEHGANQSVGGFWEEGGPPQAGLVSCRSGHHFTVEGCTIRHAKSIGLDCGREGADRALDGQAAPPLREVGYHLIRDNTISDNGECGLTGIGHVGTRVLDNRIERNNCLGFGAVEEAGIKFHYFIDGVIEGNLIRDNDGHGIWLDNVWSGSRVSRNVCIGNVGSGIFIEMGDGPMLVDNNVCAFSRAGEGIYLHDSSGVCLAHNLLYGNAHWGVLMRTVSDRKFAVDGFASPDGEWKSVATARNRLWNNLFVDNYRGTICLPFPSERDRDNASDGNLFLGGTQWHWENRPLNPFGLRGQEAGALKANQPLSLDEWRAETGFDAHSREETSDAGEVENGAVTQGGATLNGRALSFELRAGQSLQRSKGIEIETEAAPSGADTAPSHDFEGRPIVSQDARPGPFQNVASGPNRWMLWPVRRPHAAPQEVTPSST